MHALSSKQLFSPKGRLLLPAVALLLAIPLLAGEKARQSESQASSQWTLQNECRFSDGSTIQFGRAQAADDASIGDVWQTSDYVATTVSVAGHVWLAPVGDGIDVPAGNYTLFLDRSKGTPWTLIVSKKSVQGGAYPGAEYDLGRTRMGYGMHAVGSGQISIGCMVVDSRPMFIWAESGAWADMAKVASGAMPGHGTSSGSRGN